MGEATGWEETAASFCSGTSETYERYHAESLQNMSKQELIKEYSELEKCLSRMEDENNRLRLESQRLDGDEARVGSWS